MKRAVDPDIRLLQAIADPTRLAIVRQLGEEGAVCACDFTACCEVAQPTVSHHLRVLREAGWVTSERRGTWVYYSLNPGAAERLEAIAKTVGRGVGAGRAHAVAASALGGRRPPLTVLEPADGR